MAGPKHIDWRPIKTEYVTSNATYRELSEKYGVSIAQISRVCKKEKWTEQRKQHAEKCFMKAEQKAASREANHLARLITATTKAVDVAMEAFEDPDQFNRYLINRREKYLGGKDASAGDVIETEWTEEQRFAKVDTKALKDLTGVLKDLTGLMREFYNIPTPAQAEAQRIAAERLELDKKKADAEEGVDKDVTVHFESGEVESYSE